jgi:hypothetical protein
MDTDVTSHARDTVPGTPPEASISAPQVATRTWLSLAAFGAVFLVVVVRSIFGPPSESASGSWWLAGVAGLAVLGGAATWWVESRRRAKCSELRARALDIAAADRIQAQSGRAIAPELPQRELQLIAARLRQLGEYAFSDEVDQARRQHAELHRLEVRW